MVPDQKQPGHTTSWLVAASGFSVDAHKKTCWRPFNHRMVLFPILWRGLSGHSQSLTTPCEHLTLSSHCLRMVTVGSCWDPAREGAGGHGRRQSLTES